MLISSRSLTANVFDGRSAENPSVALREASGALAVGSVCARDGRCLSTPSSGLLFMYEGASLPVSRGFVTFDVPRGLLEYSSFERLWSRDTFADDFDELFPERPYFLKYASS